VAPEYAFFTRWRVKGTAEEVFDVLEDPLGLPRWWPSVYLEVHELAPGDPVTRVGRVIDLYTKGWLPYTLRWNFTVTQSKRPAGFSLVAHGDFEGTGVWKITQDGDVAEATYDWRISAEKPLLRYGSLVFRPIFAANHRWAMARGEESLDLELRRRRGERVPEPPRPTFTRR
jgi:hypothetical protein